MAFRPLCGLDKRFWPQLTLFIRYFFIFQPNSFSNKFQFKDLKHAFTCIWLQGSPFNISLSQWLFTNCFPLLWLCITISLLLGCETSFLWYVSNPHLILYSTRWSLWSLSRWVNLPTCCVEPQSPCCALYSSLQYPLLMLQFKSLRKRRNKWNVLFYFSAMAY